MKAGMKKRWSSMVNDLKFNDDLRAIPESRTIERLLNLDIDPKLKKFKVPTNGLKIYTRNSSSNSTYQAILAMTKSTKSVYVRKTDKRINER